MHKVNIGNQSNLLSDIKTKFKVLKLLMPIDQDSNPSCLKRIKNHPMVQHIKMLTTFFVFQVALLGADIVTDIMSALEFFDRGHNYWGVFTLVPIFAPFGAKVFITFANFSRCLKLTTLNLWGVKIPSKAAIAH